jgi:hypothetical protein
MVVEMSGPINIKAQESCEKGQPVPTTAIERANTDDSLHALRLGNGPSTR